MFNRKIKFLSSVLAFSFSFLPFSTFAATFNDVSETHKHYVAIEYLKKASVIKGYDDGTFKPSSTINRAEVLKIILEGSKIASPEITEAIDFPDVKVGDWFAKYVIQAKKIGIVKGNADGTFAPSRSVNKVELLKMLLIANNVDVSGYASSDQVFLDADQSAWYFPYLNFAQATGLIRFNGEAKLEPSKELTRGEVADIMYLLIALKNQNNSKFLLEQSELQVASSINLINTKSYDDAYNAADVAYDFASQALNVDKLDTNKPIIESAIKLSDSIRQLIDTYRTIIQEGNCNAAIEQANQTKITATQAWEKNHDVQKVARLIKDLADSLIIQCNDLLSGQTTQ